MRVPLLDLAAQFRSVENELLEATQRVVRSTIYILGPEVEAVEREMADFAGVKHGIGISNGSDAIATTLMSLGIGYGDEVIVPAFTFFGTAGSVARVGATPVFADILPDTFNIDPQAVEAAITSRTKAVMPVHLYGQCADMIALRKITDKHQLALVEDAAQAIGATFADKGIGQLGTAATLSFYPTKNLSAIGEAGMVLTNDSELDAHLRSIRNHGQGKSYEHLWLGGNFRLDAIQAAALRIKFKKLPDWNNARRTTAAAYDEGLSDTDVTTPPIDPRCHHVYHQYTIRSDRRDDLRAFLGEKEIGSGIYYPLPVHLQPCFEHLGYKKGQFPVAEQACRECLSLPIFPELSSEQRDYVIEQIKAFG
jgi:dTDP-4-amino-4,6-dideoxygalactose transaminase